jgi:GNAT superfamily N-acetyltransferase
MEIVNFKQEHIPMAMQIAKDNYEMEQRVVTILPEIGLFPEMEYFVENGLGVAAVLGDQLVGFLCSYRPREDAFGTTNVRGGYVPLYGHGVACDMDENSRERIYSKLYQAAAEKWVNAGIRSHAITLYAHDREGEKSFFYNGFGLRCMDLIRNLDIIPSAKDILSAKGDKVDYVELFRDEWVLLLKQHNALIHHLGNSPSFMYFEPVNEEGLYKQAAEDVRYFAAKVNGKLIAYIKLSDCGENFATEVDDMINICGAYCEPEFRGTGIYHNLLCHVMRELKREGYHLLGVDCESFNLTARGFWTKYFIEYTHSVVRRIDEKAVNEKLKNII